MRVASRLVAATIAVSGLFAGAASAAEAAAEKPQASGKFESKNWEVEVSGAYAFPGEVGLDDEDGILVAVANTAFATERLDRLWDRRHALDTRFANQEVLVVYFHFSKLGKYEGLSYYFGSGDGCAYCYDGTVQSTVRVQNGRLSGKLVSPPKEGEVSFDLQIDVPVATRDYGTALPAGFGDFAKLYADFHKVVVDGPASALAPFLTDAEAADLEKSGDAILEVYRENHPTKTYTLKRGWSRGDHALLLIEGENSFAAFESEAHFVREGGRWRIFDEIGQLKLGG